MTQQTNILDLLSSKITQLHHNSYAGAACDAFISESMRKHKPAVQQYHYPKFVCAGSVVHEMIEQMNIKFGLVYCNVVGGEAFFISDNAFVRIMEMKMVESDTKFTGLSIIAHQRAVALEIQAAFAGYCEDTEHQIDINWVLDAKGSSQNLISKYSPSVFSDALYPYIEGGANDYIERYLKSSATMLILIGAPGTGKTSFIKHLVYKSKAGAFITYDEDALNTDSVFSSFLGHYSYDNFVIEDADNFLRPRTEGNSMMSRFLNIGDGLVKIKHKKIIFSTNLPSVAHIDPALTRPGRCFDVLQFRELTKNEAQKIADDKGLVLPDKKSYSLGDIFNVPQPVTAPKRSVGFV